MREKTKQTDQSDSRDERIEKLRELLAAPDVFIADNSVSYDSALKFSKVRKAIKFTEPGSGEFYVIPEDANDYLEEIRDGLPTWTESPAILIEGEP